MHVWRSIVPNVSVFRGHRIPFLSWGKIANRFDIHPDWAIEILSPDQSLTKVLGQLLHCLQQGTELRWFLAPEKESLLAVFTGQTVELYTGNTRLPVFSEIKFDLTVEQILNGWSFS